MADPSPEPKSPSPSERRKYPRIETEDLISFSHVDATHQLGVSKDVSAGGIRFEAVGCEIALGDVLRATFNVGAHTVTAVCEVVWATELDPLTQEVGLAFVEIDPADLRLLEESSEAIPPI